MRNRLYHFWVYKFWESERGSVWVTYTADTYHKMPYIINYWQTQSFIFSGCLSATLHRLGRDIFEAASYSVRALCSTQWMRRSALPVCIPNGLLLLRHERPVVKLPWIVSGCTDETKAQAHFLTRRTSKASNRARKQIISITCLILNWIDSRKSLNRVLHLTLCYTSPTVLHFARSYSSQQIFCFPRVVLFSFKSNCLSSSAPNPS